MAKKERQEDILIDLVMAEDMGEALRGKREERDKRDYELAVFIGRDPSTIRRWERGEISPKMADLKRIAEVLSDWPKASKLSSPQEAYSFSFTPLPEFDLGLTTAA